MMLTIHFVFYIFLVLIASPEHIHSTGLHQTVTYDCDHMKQESIQTAGIVSYATCNVGANTYAGANMFAGLVN